MFFHRRLGTPKRHTMFFQTKCCTLCAVICATGSASIHFVKYSIATIKYFLPYRQWKRAQDVDPPGVERPRTVYGPQFLWRCLVPIGVLLALLAPLGVSDTIFPHGWPIETRTYYLGCQRSSPHVAPTNPFMEFRHYPCALISTHTRQDWVCKPMPE